MSNENRELIVTRGNELKATAVTEGKQLVRDVVEAARKPLHDHGNSLLDCFLDWIVSLANGSAT